MAAVAPDQALVGFIDHAEADYAPGQIVEVVWRVAGSQPVGWGELAIATGDPVGGNQPMTVLGVADVTAQLSTTAAMVTVSTSIPLTHAIAAGEGMWLILAGWVPPGGVSPTVVASSVYDTINAGTMGTIDVPGWKPSQNINQVVVANAQGAPRSVSAAVIFPDPP
jgi:hypothetical protein